MFRHSFLASTRAISSSIRTSTQTPALRARHFQFPAPIRSQQAAQRSIARWYSEESRPAAQDTSKEGESKNETNNAESEDPTMALRKELEEKKKEMLEWKDIALRSKAEFQNLQDRTAREMKSARDFAIQKFAKDLVDSVDNLDRALAIVPEEKLTHDEQTEHLRDLISLYEGLKLTESVLMQTLKKHGLERFDPHGVTFNPNEHEATFMAPMPDKEQNTVFHVQQKGFKLNGRVLRPAKVGVVKNS